MERSVNAEAGFGLDERLAGSTARVADLALSRLLLADDATYPWLILVPRRAGIVEVVDLARDDRIALLDEIAAVSEALRATTGCHKLNVAALGNAVPQLHVHVIARFRDDPAWPGPIGGAAPPTAREPAVRDALVEALREALVSTSEGQAPVISSR
jgi:diadenosine tetraphosphate (Ap4A) HIT family hydrolase